MKAKRVLGFVGIILKHDPPKIGFSLPLFIPTEIPDTNRIIMKALWQEFDDYFMVRNCIAHHNGFIQNLRNPNKIIKYATKKKILIDESGHLEILLNTDFNAKVCETMVKFFGKLASAYYNIPLPQ